MRLNVIEKILLNNPARRMVQRFFEAPLLLRMAGRLDGKRTLEIGCGQGFGMEIILGRFGAAKVSGIDLDPQMVARAQKRILLHAGRAEVSVGDVTAILAPDQSFDAVFDFGVIHHVVPTENSVRINQHPCGALIADLVDALSLLASTSESKDWQSLPRPVVECIQVQGVRVAKESGFDQQKFGRVDQGEAAFPLRKANVEATGLLWLSGASLISVV